MGGDTVSRDKYTGMLLKALRQTAYGIALILLIYLAAALGGYVPTSPLFSPITAGAIGAAVVFYILWLNTQPEASRSRLGIYHFVPLHLPAMLLPLLITGFMSPVNAMWVILIVSIDILYGRKFMLLSVALLVATALMSIGFASSEGETSAAGIVVYTVVIIVLSWFVTLLRNITLRQHLDIIAVGTERADEQIRLMTLINSLNEAVVSINKQGLVQFYNAAALNLLDTNQSLTGKKIDDVVPVQDEQGTVISLYKTLTGSSPTIMRDDLKHCFENGETINLAINSSRIHGNSNDTVGYILILRDITHEKSLEEERDEFISVVSHELRTPVAITEGTVSNVRMLMKKGAGASVVEEALRVAHEQTLYLSRMINDLSTLSRAERGIGDEKELIRVNEFVHDIYREYEPKAAAANLKLNLDVSGNPGTIRTSRLYVEEILQNFLTNAIKYTPKGRIDFIVRAVDGQVVFSVKDSGIGISKAEHGRIFDKFYRSEDYRTRETKGTGLGLYIVQKLARKISTQVELESRLNHGSTFSIRLPQSS